MHKIAESGFASYVYLITDICLDYLKVGDERRLGKSDFRLLYLMEGGEMMRGKTMTVFAACVQVLILYIPLRHDNIFLRPFLAC